MVRAPSKLYEEAGEEREDEAAANEEGSAGRDSAVWSCEWHWVFGGDDCRNVVRGLTSGCARVGQGPNVFGEYTSA